MINSRTVARHKTKLIIFGLCLLLAKPAYSFARDTFYDIAIANAVKATNRSMATLTDIEMNYRSQIRDAKDTLCDGIDLKIRAGDTPTRQDVAALCADKDASDRQIVEAYRGTKDFLLEQ